jgi:hypothetical protein
MCFMPASLPVALMPTTGAAATPRCGAGVSLRIAAADADNQAHPIISARADCGSHESRRDEAPPNRPVPVSILWPALISGHPSPAAGGMAAARIHSEVRGRPGSISSVELLFSERSYRVPAQILLKYSVMSGRSDLFGVASFHPVATGATCLQRLRQSDPQKPAVHQGTLHPLAAEALPVSVRCLDGARYPNLLHGAQA